MTQLVVEDLIFQLAEHAVSVRYEDIPIQAVEVTKMDILDCLGVALAASSVVPVCKKVADLAKEMGGKEESTIIGYGGKVPAPMAAFVNAALIHSLNYDDYYDPLIIHFGCSVCPAAFAIAERVGKVSGKDFITAFTISTDLEARLGRALVLKKTHRDWNVYGWLMTQIFGYFGATAVAGRIMGLKQDQMLNAFGLAYSQVAGNKQPLLGAGSDKGIYPSYPAKSGVLSVLMAQRGIAGPKDSLEGQAGLYNVYFQGEYDSVPVVEELGKSFAGAGFYQFPCGGFGHLSIEIVLQMVNEHGIRPEDVESVTVSAGPKLQPLFEPLQVRRNPRTMTEAQYSLPFPVAVAISKGKPRVEHFTLDGIRDTEILNIANKVSYRSAPDCDPQWGTGVQVARVEICMKDGRVFRSEQKGFRYGHPQRPMSKEELIKKFKECAAYSIRPLSKDSVERIIKMVDNLEDMDDVSPIIWMVS